MIKEVIKQKFITAGFGLALLLISGVSVVALGNLTSTLPLANGINLMWIVAIANSFATLLLGWVGVQLWRWFTNAQTSEQALRQSEERFRLAVDYFPYVFVIYDADRRLQFVNRHGIQISGYQEQDLLGHRDEELFSSDVTQTYLPLLQQAIETRTAQTGECTLTLKSGTSTIVVNYVPLLDERGEIYQILGITHNITERKQAEEALRLLNEELEVAITERMTQLRQVYEDILTEIVERKRMEEALRTSEERFRIALQNAPTVVFNQDTELRYTWIYDSNSQSDAERFIGKSDTELFPEEDAKRLSGIKRRVLTTGRGTREETCLTIYGEVRYYDLTVEPLRNRTGSVVGITCAATDITDIRVREQQLRAIFEQSLDALIIADDEGTYLEANPAASQLFNLPLSELLGRRIPDFMEPGFDFELAWRSFREQGQLMGEVRLVCPDGTVRDVDFAAKADFLPGRHLSILRDISDRKRAEAALRDSQHLLQTIADTIPNNLYIYDLKLNRISYANRRTEEFFGRTQAELQEMGSQFIAEFLHPDDIEQMSQFMERFAQASDDEVIEHELRLKNARGEWRWFRAWEVIFTRTTDGKPQQILGAATDITERKQTEEALRLSEMQLRTALAAARMGTWDWNLITDQVVWSENFKSVLGIAADRFDGTYKSLIRMIHPEDRDRVLLKVKQVLQKRESYEDEFRIILPDGNIRWLATVGQIFSDETGKLVRMAGLDLDITYRKQVELALVEERNFISAILETANALIVVLDEQGRFIRINRACEQITGYSFEEVKGKYIWDLFLIPEEVEGVQAVIQELQAGQFPKQHDNYWVARDGSRRLISWFNTVILDVDGSVKHIVSTGIDITDRKRAEEMHRALEREQALSELRLRFFSMASHEFRTPLSTILLTAQILESSTGEWSEEKRKRNLRRIISAAKEMRQMLDDILTINRAETGRLEFAPSQIDITAFCHQLLEDVQSSLVPQHTLTFSNPSEVEWVFGDEKLLRYTLKHLFCNAIKYSPDGGEVCLVLNSTNQEIIFQIRDQGIGISPSDQPHLFDAFYRGENVDCISGSGLGLTVAKKCVELQGGNITFTTEFGVGTTFTVTLPCG